MPMAKISKFARGAIMAEIHDRAEAGETPRQTVESIVDDMVRDRLAQFAQEVQK